MGLGRSQLRKTPSEESINLFIYVYFPSYISDLRFTRTPLEAGEIPIRIFRHMRLLWKKQKLVTISWQMLDKGAAHMEECNYFSRQTMHYLVIWKLELLTS